MPLCVSQRRNRCRTRKGSLFSAFPDGLTITQPPASVTRYLTSFSSIGATSAAGAGRHAPLPDAPDRNNAPSPTQAAAVCLCQADRQILRRGRECSQRFCLPLSSYVSPLDPPFKKKALHRITDERLCSRKASLPS